MDTAGDPDQALERVISHASGAALVVGSAGAGRTEALARRLARLVDAGVGPDAVLVCCGTLACRAALRDRAEVLVDAPQDELWIETWESLAERFLREYSLEAGLDPFFEVAGPADQLAVMLDRQSELPLRRHEIRGNPAGLLTRLLERIVALKREGIGPSELRELARRSEREAEGRAPREAARKELEFADLFEAHDAIMRERGSIDRAELLGELGSLLRGHSDVAAAIARRFPQLMIDELEDAAGAAGGLVAMLGAAHGNVVAAADVGQGLGSYLAASERATARFLEAFPDAELIHLEGSHRGTEGIQSARAAISGLVPESYRELDPIELVEPAEPEEVWSDDSVRLWRCANERAEAQAVAREIERVLAGGGVAAGEICVVAPREGRGPRLVAGALEERGVPFRSAGSAAFFHRAEVRDALAWLRALADPTDSAAVVRALIRPPVELSSVDLACCTTIARRRKLDMIGAAEAALESPQLPPPSRDRVRAFLKLYRAATAAMETLRPDAFVRRLIERVGFRRHGLFGASPETAERLVNLARLAELASSWSQRRPDGSTREFVAYLAAVAEAGRRFSAPLEGPPAEHVLLADPEQVKGMEFERLYLVGLERGAFRKGSPGGEWVPEQLLAGALPPAGADASDALEARRAYLAAGRAGSMLVLSYPEQTGGSTTHPSPVYDTVRAALEIEEETHEEELFGPAEGLHSTYRMIRDEVLEASWRAGAALSEMRLDTPEDVNRAVARFYELLKLAALIQRPGNESEREALDALNELLRRVATPEQVAELERSSLDEFIVTERGERERRLEQLARRAEPGLEAFIPKRGGGIGLSASDVDLYRTCPLKYKFARVFAIPQEPTINLRFGILIHNVLQTFHAEEIREAPSEEGGIKRLLDLFEAGWRRTGFGFSDDELQYRDRAVAALARYHERHAGGSARPIWLERGFSFDIGGHNLRGRIDRVDRHPDGSYELIDYKTGPAKRREDLTDDVQIALYRLAVAADWGIEAADGSYWYVMEDEKATVAGDPADLERVRDIVLDVAEGVGSQDFEPKPEFESCSWCDYRLICPASEA